MTGGETARRKRWSDDRGRDPSAVSAARAWCHDALRAVLSRPPGEQLEGEVELAVTELVANAVRHGGGVEELALSTDGETLQIAVRDHDPAEPVVPAAESDDEHGWGLLIVSRLATAWGVRQHPGDGKSVWLDFAL
ncbi:ATP-binding protein [Dactylosporangium sp. CA-139066]|uniref:ATP-binding protein n=1 Tax=Dactylosporangium sp. CA-139066 TaxID=3239930 RepID=UPI003D91E018